MQLIGHQPNWTSTKHIERNTATSQWLLIQPGEQMAHDGSIHKTQINEHVGKIIRWLRLVLFGEKQSRLSTWREGNIPFTFAYQPYDIVAKWKVWIIPWQLPGCVFTLSGMRSFALGNGKLALAAGAAREAQNGTTRCGTCLSATVQEPMLIHRKGYSRALILIDTGISWATHAKARH